MRLRVTGRLRYFHIHEQKHLHHSLSAHQFANIIQQSRPPPSLRKASPPLRILFCGSDDFSCRSLRSLSVEHNENRKLIERVEVMVRPGKRMGRGRKEVHQVPCRTEAEKLGLKVHERDTFTGWNLPEGTNLVICVSFGLFVPRRILGSARFGGLNIHPSMLPHLRGPAPIHHAVMRGDSHIGVTLQTLDPSTFDHGAIVSQTPAPGVPISLTQPFPSLVSQLGNLGAAMLVQGLRDGVHVPPLHSMHPSTLEQASAAKHDDSLVHAPKMSKEYSHIQWSKWTAQDWQRRLSVFQGLWTHVGSESFHAKRVIFSEAEVLLEVPKSVLDVTPVVMRFGGQDAEADTSEFETYSLTDESGAVYVKVGGRSGEFWVCLKTAKLEGSTEKSASVALSPFRLKATNDR